MVADAFVAVMYLVAALAEAQTKVSILEAVAEGGVEAPDLLERPPGEGAPRPAGSRIRKRRDLFTAGWLAGKPA